MSKSDLGQVIVGLLLKLLLVLMPVLVFFNSGHYLYFPGSRQPAFNDTP